MKETNEKYADDPLFVSDVTQTKRAKREDESQKKIKESLSKDGEVRVSPKEYLGYVKAEGRNLNTKFSDGKVGAGFTSTRMEIVTLQQS